MEILKKIKFKYILLILALYMGVNIGLKYKELNDVIYGNETEKTLELIDTYQFDDKLFEFYYDGTSESIVKLNGTQVKFHSGYYNTDKTRHIYIEQWNKRTIKQNGEIIEPIYKIESNKFKNIYIYEFDVNSEIIGKSIDKENDTELTSSLVDNKQVDIDLNELDKMMSIWRKMDDDEIYARKFKQYNLLQYENNWDVYAFLHCNFSTYHDSYSFNLIDNEKIIIEAKGNSYELTQKQYDEFVNFITK